MSLYPPLCEGNQSKSVHVLVRLNGTSHVIRVAYYSYHSKTWILMQPPPYKGCEVTEWWPIPYIGSGIKHAEGDTVI